MRQSLAIIAILASSGAIAADTIPFFFPGGSEGVDPVATVKAVKASTTEFRLACPTGVDASNCGYGPGLDYTIVSGTHYQAQMSAAKVSMSYACDYNSKATEMTCTVAMTGGNVDVSEPQTAVLKGDEVKFNTATVVQGASLLSGASGATASSGAAASTSATPKATPATTGGLMVAATSPVATGSMKPTGATPSTSGQAAQHTGAATRLSLQNSALLALAGMVVLSVW